MNNRGISLLEVVVGIFLISLVLITSATVLINARAQVEATRQRQTAIQYGNYIRAVITGTTTANDFSDVAYLDEDNCPAQGFYEGFCTLMFAPDVESFERLSDHVEIIRTTVRENQEEGYLIVEIVIRITYYRARYVELEAVLDD